MAQLLDSPITLIQKRVEEVCIYPPVHVVADLVASQSLSTGYLSPSNISEDGTRTLLITQPIIVIIVSGECQCVCGIRTLQAVKTNLPPSSLINVYQIESAGISQDELVELAKSDLFLKTFFNLYLSDPDLLAEAYKVYGKESINNVAPGKHVKAKFAKSAGYSRQRVFYDQKKAGSSS